MQFVEDKENPLELKKPKVMLTVNGQKHMTLNLSLRRWVQLKKGELSLADFKFSPKGKVVACPLGHPPEIVRKKESASGLLPITFGTVLNCQNASSRRGRNIIISVLAIKKCALQSAEYTDAQTGSKTVTG